MFENIVLRKTFGFKMEEITGEWRNFYNSQLYYLCFSPDVILMIKYRRLRYRFWWENRKELGHFEDEVLVGK